MARKGKPGEAGMRSGHSGVGVPRLVRWTNPASSSVDCGGQRLTPLSALEGTDVNLQLDVGARTARTLHGGWDRHGAEWFQPSLALFDPRTPSLDLLAAHPPPADQ